MAGRRYITDLRPEEFSLYENGVKQKIAMFGSVEEPFNVALLLDSSGSTAAQLDQIKSAAATFIAELRPQDRATIATFNDSVQYLSELTSDRAALARAISTIKAGEFTQVYEAVYTAVWERFRKLEGRKAVILFTDGIDTASTELEAADTLDAIIECEDIIVYPIRYNTRDDVERKMEARLRASKKGSGEVEAEIEKQIRELDRTYRSADEYLQQLADISGGVLEQADQLGDLHVALSRIAQELRQQYLLGYYPSNNRDERGSRRIRVDVARPNLKVRARPEYRMSQ
jgi:VWFA-related protein